MKINIYTICKNEIKLAPFAVQYWKQYANKVYVYDNGSDDGTIEYLSQFPELIEIRHFVTDGLDDRVNVGIKNDAWKESRGVVDWVVVCDFDEYLYSKKLTDNLLFMKNNGYTVCRPLSFSLVSEIFPEYDCDRLLHEVVNSGFNDCLHETKAILFDPNKIDDINYNMGAHAAFPTGDVKWFTSNSLFLIHAKYLSLKHVLDKIDKRKMSSNNVRLGLFGEQNRSVDERTNEYMQLLQKSFKWEDIEKNFDLYYNIVSCWSPWGCSNVYGKNVIKI